MRKAFKKFKDWYEEHERLARAGAFMLGFIFDNLTLTRVDLVFGNVMLTSYLLLAAGGIIVLYAHAGGKIRRQFNEHFGAWIELIISFSFGSLFSGYVVFYAKSASFIDSWPFLLMLTVLFVGNELFRKYYQFLVFQLSIFFVTLFSYLIFSIPVLLKEIGATVFLLSGVLSLLFFIGLVAILWKVEPERIRKAYRNLFVSIGAIYLLFNLAYFTNIIPPIPLSLREIGVYHRVLAGQNGYTLTFEPAPWYLRFFGRTNEVFHFKAGEPVYVFSAVFAPTKLTTTVYHEWSYFDPTTEAWVKKARVSFPIVGGRDGGYRGYSLKESLVPGKWRVEVQTERGQLIGRITFTAVAATTAPVIKTISQ
ncbi:MAG TPA: DUF2914 domain-containing protein [Candidatus Paceibacterota bacterium]